MDRSSKVKLKIIINELQHIHIWFSLNEALPPIKLFDGKRNLKIYYIKTDPG